MLDKSKLNRFIEIYANNYGVYLNETDALEKATKIINLTTELIIGGMNKKLILYDYEVHKKTLSADM